MIKFLNENFTTGAIVVFSIATIFSIFLVTMQKNKPIATYQTGAVVDFHDWHKADVRIMLWGNYVTKATIDPELIMSTIWRKDQLSTGATATLSIDGKPCGNITLWMNPQEFKAIGEKLQKEQEHG